MNPYPFYRLNQGVVWCTFLPVRVFFSRIFVASMKKLPTFAEVVGVPPVEGGALFILMSP